MPPVNQPQMGNAGLHALRACAGRVRICYKEGMGRLGAILICAALGAACNSAAPTAPTPVNTQLVLAPGEATDISSAAIRLRFLGVSGDSRCPADALCIQGGDAVVLIEVKPTSGPPATYELHTGSMRPVQHTDLTIALMELSPYPFSSRTIAPAEYRATLRITR